MKDTRYVLMFILRKPQVKIGRRGAGHHISAYLHICISYASTESRTGKQKVEGYMDKTMIVGRKRKHRPWLVANFSNPNH